MPSLQVTVQRRLLSGTQLDYMAIRVLPALAMCALTQHYKPEIIYTVSCCHDHRWRDSYRRLFAPRPEALASLPGRFFVPPPLTPNFPLPPAFPLSLNMAFISALESALFCLPSFLRPPNPYLASRVTLFLLFPGRSAFRPWYQPIDPR